MVANFPILLGGDSGDGTTLEPKVVDCKGFGVMTVNPQMAVDIVGFGSSVVFDDHIVFALAGSLVRDAAARYVERLERLERPRRPVVAHGEVGVGVGDCQWREVSRV